MRVLFIAMVVVRLIDFAPHTDGSQDDVGDMVQKFTGPPPGAGGNLPQRSVIVAVGPPFTSPVRGRPVEPEPLPIARAAESAARMGAGAE